MERPTLLAVGGQFNVDQWNYKERYDGVYVMRAANLSEMLSQAFFPFDVSGWGHRMPHAPWQEERVGRVLGGVHNGCVECRRHLKGACEYDGMLSFARHAHARRGDSPNSNLLPQWTIASVGDCSRTDGRCLCACTDVHSVLCAWTDARVVRAASATSTSSTRAPTCSHTRAAVTCRWHAPRRTTLEGHTARLSCFGSRAWPSRTRRTSTLARSSKTHSTRGRSSASSLSRSPRDWVRAESPTLNSHAQWLVARWHYIVHTPDACTPSA